MAYDLGSMAQQVFYHDELHVPRASQQERDLIDKHNICHQGYKFMHSQEISRDSNHPDLDLLRLLPHCPSPDTSKVGAKNCVSILKVNMIMGQSSISFSHTMPT